MWSRRRRSTFPAPERVKALAGRQQRPESSMVERASEKIPTNKTQRDCKIDNYSNTSNYPNASNDKLLISMTIQYHCELAPHSAGTTQLATAQLASAGPLRLGSKQTSALASFASVPRADIRFSPNRTWIAGPQSGRSTRPLRPSRGAYFLRRGRAHTKI